MRIVVKDKQIIGNGFGFIFSFSQQLDFPRINIVEDHDGQGEPHLSALDLEQDLINKLIKNEFECVVLCKIFNLNLIEDDEIKVLFDGPEKIAGHDGNVDLW